MNQIAIIPSRLPMPQGLNEMDAGKWRVLCESIFPSAKTAEAVALALDYCRARKLDVFRKPVNIVPMWSTALGKMVETVWPSINSVQIDAARSNSWAGMDEPKWGPDITRKFSGVLKNNVGPTEIEVTFPEWCSITVYRIVQGQRFAFTEPVFWTECYARREKTELPNEMWAKRPRGQFLKVAKAFSLRAAFPEDADYTAEEMEGRVIEEVEANNGMVINNEPKAIKSLFKNAALRNEWCRYVQEQMDKATDKEELLLVLEGQKAKCEELITNGNENDVLAVENIRQNADIILKRFKAVPREGSEAEVKAMQGLPPEEDEFDREPGEVA